MVMSIPTKESLKHQLDLLNQHRTLVNSLQASGANEEAVWQFESECVPLLKALEAEGVRVSRTKMPLYFISRREMRRLGLGDADLR